ncbi:MAG: archease [Phycisphaerae bacterium]
MTDPVADPPLKLPPLPAGASVELVEHTADIAIRVAARNFPDLVIAATWGMLACIGDLVPLDPDRASETFQFRTPRRDDQLHDWLSTVLWRVETRQQTISSGPTVAEVPGGIDVTIGSARIDPARSRWAREVKAVTYHQLAVEPTADGLTAQLIFDI